MPRALPRPIREERINLERMLRPRPRGKIGDEPTVLSVADLTLLIKESLQSQFSSVWVSGELSDVSQPHSGHVYFTLKDARAQIRGVIWRSVATQLQFSLEDGLEVV